MESSEFFTSCSLDNRIETERIVINQEINRLDTFHQLAIYRRTFYTACCEKAFTYEYLTTLSKPIITEIFINKCTINLHYGQKTQRRIISVLKMFSRFT